MRRSTRSCSATVTKTERFTSTTTFTASLASPLCSVRNEAYQPYMPDQLYWATVCKTVCLYAIGPLSSPVLSCLSVMLVYCGQTVGRIKMKLSKLVGLGIGHIVLDGDPAPPHKGHSPPQFSAHVYCGQTVAHLSYC